MKTLSVSSAKHRSNESPAVTSAKHASVSSGNIARPGSARLEATSKDLGVTTPQRPFSTGIREDSATRKAALASLKRRSSSNLGTNQ